MNDTSEHSHQKPSLRVPCKLIGICGHARAGKDTVGRYLHEKHENTYKLAFADPLKQAASELFGIPLHEFYGDEKEQVDEFWRVSPRKIAQFFGTEMVRETMHTLLPDIGSDFWIARMVHCLTGQGEQVAYDEDDVVILSDVRFQNEYNWIMDNGGIVIHLTRPGADGTVGISGHQSEAGFNFSTPERTYRAINFGTLEELYTLIDVIIDAAKIYPLSDPNAF